jgi:DNA-binding MarR family transcriptional regulator
VDDPTSDTNCVADDAERSELLAQMRDVLTSLRSVADERLAIHEITYKQGVPLRHLLEGSSPSVLELANSVGIDPGSMTRMIDRLEAKGLVERQRSPTDRRIVEVRLLAPGARVAAQVDDVLAGVSEDHLTDFSRQERANLRELLERMRSNGRTTTIP